MVEHLKTLLKIDQTEKRSPLAFLQQYVIVPRLCSRQIFTTVYRQTSVLFDSSNHDSHPRSLPPPLSFSFSLHDKTALETKPLRFAYSRLNSLLRTLEVTHLDEYNPLQVRRDINLSRERTAVHDTGPKQRCSWCSPKRDLFEEGGCL